MRELRRRRRARRARRARSGHELRRRRIARRVRRIRISRGLSRARWIRGLRKFTQDTHITWTKQSTLDTRITQVHAGYANPQNTRSAECAEYVIVGERKRDIIVRAQIDRKEENQFTGELDSKRVKVT